MLEGREWFGFPGASAEEIATLKALLPAALPERYLALLSFTNGGEGPLPVRPLNLCLDPSETVAKNLREGTFGEFFPGFLVIGGDGGGNVIAFDLRNPPPFPIVTIDLVNIDLNESVRLVAPDFDAFLDLIGRS